MAQTHHAPNHTASDTPTALRLRRPTHERTLGASHTSPFIRSALTTDAASLLNQTCDYEPDAR